MTRILIVDDEPDFVEVIREFVQGRGFEALVAYSGPEALQKVKDERPHIVFLDIRMPGMGGLEVLKKIREIDREVGVIMLTAVNDADTGRESLLLGAFDYLVKPVDLQYLERVLWYKIATMTL